MRAGRLVAILLALQRDGRITAARLARELEVSERTILRDIDELSGAGVPIFATRGPGGGFELLEGYRSDLKAPGPSTAVDRATGSRRRARIRITAEGRRLAAVLQFLQPLRLRRSVGPDGADRLEASFRIRSYDGAVIEVLALGPHVEVIEPIDLREDVADRVRRTARLYDEQTDI